jgi:hypothetical protein
MTRFTIKGVIYRDISFPSRPNNDNTTTTANAKVRPTRNDSKIDETFHSSAAPNNVSATFILSIEEQVGWVHLFLASIHRLVNFPPSQTP